MLLAHGMTEEAHLSEIVKVRKDAFGPGPDNREASFLAVRIEVIRIIDKTCDVHIALSFEIPFLVEAEATVLVHKGKAVGCDLFDIACKGDGVDLLASFDGITNRLAHLRGIEVVVDEDTSLAYLPLGRLLCHAFLEYDGLVDVIDRRRIGCDVVEKCFSYLSALVLSFNIRHAYRPFLLVL